MRHLHAKRNLYAASLPILPGMCIMCRSTCCCSSFGFCSHGSLLSTGTGNLGLPSDRSVMYLVLFIA
jgi:hypothetical protein